MYLTEHFYASQENERNEAIKTNLDFLNDESDSL